MMMTPEAETHTPLLICQMAQQRYALRLPHVVEVSAMVTVTILPDSHPALLGMANRRGAPLPIYDLRRVFGFARAAIDVNTLFIVVQADDWRAGLVVDDVFQVQYVQADAVQATQSGGRWISHVISTGEHLYQVLDVATLLQALITTN